MNGSRSGIAVLALVLSGALVSVAFADSGDNTPIPELRQERLLERFADQGIDADGDGTLTRDEVRAFFAERRPGDMAGKRGMGHKAGPHRPGMKGMSGRGHRGMRDDMGRGMRGAMHRGMMLCMDYEMINEQRQAMLLKHHPEVDTDEDGTLSAGEFEAFRTKMILEHHPKADADEDGTLSDAEFAAFRTKMILLRHPAADTDGDGVLSDEEFAAFVEARTQERQARMLERHPEADTDGDGALSEEEIEAFQAKQGQERLAWILKRHPEADTNGDGTLSEEEARAFKSSRRGPAWDKDGPPHRGMRRGCGKHGR